MSCIKDHVIQKYIDNEANKKEIAFVEDHITHCKRCASEIEHRREFSGRIKREINLLAATRTEIPEMVTERGFRRRFVGVKRVVYGTAAACLLLFILIFSQTREEKNRHKVTVISDYALDVDANRPPSQQELSIYIIDQNGNYSEYFIQ